MIAVMISKLNLERIVEKDFDYIMGVKHRQEKMVPMLLGGWIALYR